MVDGYRKIAEFRKLILNILFFVYKLTFVIYGQNICT